MFWPPSWNVENDKLRFSLRLQAIIGIYNSLVCELIQDDFLLNDQYRYTGNARMYENVVSGNLFGLRGQLGKICK